MSIGGGSSGIRTRAIISQIRDDTEDNAHYSGTPYSRINPLLPMLSWIDSQQDVVEQFYNASLLLPPPPPAPGDAVEAHQNPL